MEGTDEEKLKILLPEEKSNEWLLNAKMISFQSQEFTQLPCTNLIRLALKIQNIVYSDIESRGFHDNCVTLKDTFDLMAKSLETFVTESCKLNANILSDNPSDDHDEDDESTNFIGMLIQLIELSTTLLKFEESEDSFINSNQMYTVLLFMIITKEQEELLLNDPNQFISDEENEFTSKDLKSW